MAIDSNPRRRVPFCRLRRRSSRTCYQPDSVDRLTGTLSGRGSHTFNRDEPKGGAGAARFVLVLAGVFFALSTWTSYLRWADFRYRTFDLAYYVQAVWQLIHGRFDVSVENVPLLGNHVEPIVFLFAPLFAVVRHPMLFVVLQNAALAAMAPIGFFLARRWFEPLAASMLAGALLVAPAAGYVALHEFHPEALTAPLLLLMFYGKASRRLWLHWISLVGVLACKENMALLLGAYCAVFLVIERRLSVRELWRWYGGPLLLAILWFLLCTRVITPAFNSGNIDYVSLYDRIGKSAGEIAWNAFSQPQLIGRALLHSIMHGNLVAALLLPFLALPLLRPRWLIIASPVLLQHLLSWRSSEWTIYFHYAAPLLPLFWMGAVEALAMLRHRQFGIGQRHHPGTKGQGPASEAEPTSLHGPARTPRPLTTAAKFSLAAAGFMLVGCLTAQIWIGPARTMVSELSARSIRDGDRLRKEALIQKIPANASVVAPLPYLSHLAMREKLFSLHYILKGLKTLSHERYRPPPPPDLVLVDYADGATFDATSGYYHPEMRTADGQSVPSSDRLLHDFLGKASWSKETGDALTLFRRLEPNRRDRALVEGQSVANQNVTQPVAVGAGNKLNAIGLVPQGRGDGSQPELWLTTEWEVEEAREVFPWMLLRLTNVKSGAATIVSLGLRAVDAAAGPAIEDCRISLSGLAPGEYFGDAIFVNNSRGEWLRAHGGDPKSAILNPSVPVGNLVIPEPRR